MRHSSQLTPEPRLPRYTAIADHAVLVEFAESIDDAAHSAALLMDQALAASPFPGFREAVPAYVSLLVEFDPLLTDHAAVEQHLRRLPTSRGDTSETPTLHEVPVCYDAPYAPDLPEVAQRTKLSIEAVIEAHLQSTYQVYMYGFAPGYAYLGGVPPQIRLDRKPAPVRGVPAGSVLIAGPQCLVTTLTMPTGWWIIGRSPSRILTGDPSKPFLFAVGDRIRFRRISAAEMGAPDA